MRDGCKSRSEAACGQAGKVSSMSARDGVRWNRDGLVGAERHRRSRIAREVIAMTASNPQHTGRHFLQIPGPTNVPDRVLRAIDQPTIDHRGPEFAELAK